MMKESSLVNEAYIYIYMCVCVCMIISSKEDIKAKE